MKRAGIACSTVLAGALACPARGGESFVTLWDRIKNDRPTECASALERYVLDGPIERDRRSALSALADLAPKAAPPLSPEEWWTLEAIQRDRADLVEIVAGRSVLLVCTAAAAEVARREGLASRLDLAALVLRELTGCDPIGARRHRWYVFADPAQHGNLRTAYDWLGVFVPWEWRDAYPFEAVCHELMHAFIADHPSKHLFAGGFGEGWCDFVPAYVCERLAPLGPPFAGRFDALAAELEGASRVEYVDTRLAIEEIVAYGPSSGMLVQLARAARTEAGAVDWKPWFELLRARGPSTLPVTSWQSWPARQARDWLRAYGSERALPILRRFRFPIGAAAQRDLEATLAPPASVGRPNAELLRARWHSEGSRVLDGWRVLGPIPDRDGRGLELDPLDARNFVQPSALGNVAQPVTLEHGGATYRWRDDLRPDPYGTLKLDDLGGGGDRCVFYLVRAFDDADPPPAEILVASDGRVAAWLDGREALRAPDRGRCDVFDPVAGFGSTKPGRHQLVVLVANDGGRCWFHARASSKASPLEHTRSETKDGDADRRKAAIDFVGSKRLARPLARELLVGALDDAAPSVRAAAAWWLGGHRNDATVVEALLERFVKERDALAVASIRSALEELCLTTFAAPADAARWWKDNERAFGSWSFVECERTVLDWRQKGGFHGNNAGAFGRQCLGRAWGAAADDWFAVDLVAREKGARRLALRYVQADRDDSALAVTISRGELVVWRGALPLARTESWTSWAWSEVEVATLEPGTYVVRVTATATTGSPDLDVLGWK